MNKMVKDGNLKHLRERLTRTTDEAECQRLVRLIEQAEAKKFGR
jgi:hypothetical protein